MTRVGLFALLISGIGCSSQGNYSVNISVEPGTFAATDRMHAAQALLTVNGDIPDPYLTPVDILRQLIAGEARFQYFPAAHSGALVFKCRFSIPP